MSKIDLPWLTNDFPKWERVRDNTLWAYDSPTENLRTLSEMLHIKNHYDEKYPISYSSDGIKDYWQTPLETIMRQSGDCEDHALYWMYRLNHGGISLNHMDLVVTLHKAKRIYHASLRVKHSKGFSFLDCMYPKSYCSLHHHLDTQIPLYSINHNGWKDLR